MYVKDVEKVFGVTHNCKTCWSLDKQEQYTWQSFEVLLHSDNSKLSNQQLQYDSVEEQSVLQSQVLNDVRQLNKLIVEPSYRYRHSVGHRYKLTLAYITVDPKVNAATSSEKVELSSLALENILQQMEETCSFRHVYKWSTVARKDIAHSHHVADRHKLSV